MADLLRKIFRSGYYFVYGRQGRDIVINNDRYRVSAYVARGINSVIDEVPLKLLGNLCLDAGVLFDIGGNIGVIALILAKKMKPGSVIYSFEPAPLSFRYLRDNARVQRGNARIIPVNLAISNNSDKLYFTNDGNSCTNHISQEQAKNTITIDSVTVDAYCKANNVAPQVIKVDIEGAEYWALEGMAETLKNNDCRILVEIHQGYLESNGITGAMFAKITSGCGYEVFDTGGGEINANEMLKHTCVILARTRPPASVFAI